MASLTDEMMGKAEENTKKVLTEMIKVAENQKSRKQEKRERKNERAPERHHVAKGICLMLGKGVKFTTKNVMRAVREKVLEKTGNIKYSERNISIEELLKKGTVRKVESAITGDVMRHFDAECKKFKIKYSAMRDDSDSQNPQYYIFYEGRAADAIIHVMEQAYKSYMEEQEQQKQNQQDKNAHNKGNEERENQQNKGKTQEENHNKNAHGKDEEERESVRAKLSFFQDRAAELDKEQDVTEKHKSKPDPQR